MMRTIIEQAYEKNHNGSTGPTLTGGKQAKVEHYDTGEKWDNGQNPQPDMDEEGQQEIMKEVNNNLEADTDNAIAEQKVHSHILGGSKKETSSEDNSVKSTSLENTHA
ncbi:hypothetical protein NDU88_008654 [Pleurodeles waltl]|uniref:Uncharacterized protein n=1 Tax=Pleurodeles waltl TaxID=8319 RepID=A0AAV7RXI0_PLEWA|nr:hypothetical protein NDU88_008654 [Pleurodeles waltl]